jgi:hypothetical protein
MFGLSNPRREKNLPVPYIMKHFKVHRRTVRSGYIYIVPLLTLLFNLIPLASNLGNPNME